MKTFLRILFCIMCIFMFLYLRYCLNHPEYSYPWSNAITYTLYFVYIIALLVVFWLAFIRKK